METEIKKEGNDIEWGGVHKKTMALIAGAILT